MVCPRGWVCHAVRAPGVKWTLAAPRRDGSGEPLARPGRGLGGVPGDLHVILLLGWDCWSQTQPLRLEACRARGDVRVWVPTQWPSSFCCDAPTTERREVRTGRELADP